MILRMPAAGALLLCSLLPAQERFEPTWESLQSRTPPSWFADAKFGIFIHWGVYAVPAFCDTSTYSEWYQHWVDTNAHDGKERKFHEENYGADFAYRDFAPMFRAEFWDPDEWAEIFERAGARYVVHTSKHHDGFCMWPSEVASEVRGHPWNSVATGPKRDLMGELTEAVRKRGLKMGLYYSFMEWHNPLFDTDKAAYVEQVMIPQIKDLITRYQPSVFWPDGEWNHPDSLWRSTEILAWMYNNAPNADELVVNDRWGKGLRGATGDFYTTEYGGHAGAGTLSGKRIFEECRGIGHSFAFNRAEGYDVYMSRTQCVRLLIDLVSQGGNLLLDIGPAADGRIPLIMVDRLLAMGRWLEKNGESIYGADAGPFTRTPWGRATAKGNKLYLHLYDWPEDGKLRVPGLLNDVRSTVLLSDRASRKVPWVADESGRGYVFDLDGRHPDQHASVLEVLLSGPPRVDNAFFPDASGRVILPAEAAMLRAKSLRVESTVDRHDNTTRYNLGYWSNTEDTAGWDRVVLVPKTEYEVGLRYGLEPGQEGGELEIQVGERTMSCTFAEHTGGWQKYREFRVGTITTDEDRVAVRVRARRIPGQALVNIRSITFTRK